MSEEKAEIVTVSDVPSSVVPIKAKEHIQRKFMEVSGELSQGLLSSITLPTGGAALWNIKCATGEFAEPEVSGVIVGFRHIRALYPKGQGNSAPLCKSVDKIHGIGDPGNDICAKCDYSQWDDRNEGGIPTCKEQIDVYIKMAGEFFPFKLNLAPTSLKNFKTWFIGLSTLETRSHDVITTLGLDKVEGGKNAYCRANFRIDREARSPEQIESWDEYAGLWEVESDPWYNHQEQLAKWKSRNSQGSSSPAPSNEAGDDVF